MKTFLILAALAAGITTASAQTPGSRQGSASAADRAGSRTAATPAASAVVSAPNVSAGNGQRSGKKINTAPATGPTRASRSSSTANSANQGVGTGSGNIESLSKTPKDKPGVKK
jgi:hypothetical protein